MEYSRHGVVLKGLEKAVARSKYEEDVLINNHTVRTPWKNLFLSFLCPILLFFVCMCVFNKESVVFSVFGAPTGKMVSGGTSVVTPWSNRVTAQERLELV